MSWRHRRKWRSKSKHFLPRTGCTAWLLFGPSESLDKVCALVGNRSQVVQPVAQQRIVQAGQHCATPYSDNLSCLFCRPVFLLLTPCLNCEVFKLHVFVVVPRTEISEITEVILWETWSCFVCIPYYFLPKPFERILNIAVFFYH